LLWFVFFFFFVGCLGGGGGGGGGGFVKVGYIKYESFVYLN